LMESNSKYIKKLTKWKKSDNTLSTTLNLYGIL
jgi:hypothetical protein